MTTRLIGLAVIVVALAIYAPSIIDRARRNHARRIERRRQRAAYWADVLNPPLVLIEDDETPIYDLLVCQQLESQFERGAS